jgi:ubiquinol oxidase
MVEEGLAQLGIFAKDYIPPGERPPNCLGFTLDDQAVRDAERIRESKVGGKVETNPIARKLYETGCWALDELFPGRPIARFWFLETIARMPYFSYVSMLHLYESFGWWRDPELRKVHNAQEYNELHHLLIMEALGGNALWRDRFLGAHVAIGYYWALCALFLVSPKAAYEFMALLESHAVDTYTTFFHENADRLKMLPAPAVAMSYYKGGDLYLFDDFQVSKKPKTRRPPCDSLYDVFKNISEDEAEHVKTMRACMDYSLLGDAVVSPHLNSDADGSITEEKRQAWLDWTEEVNRACTAEEDF